MKILRSYWLTRWVLSVGLMLMPMSAALAVNFQVTPIRADLDAKTHTALFAVRNLSPEPVRVQVSVYEWTQDASGKMELTPTRELSYFPSLLTIEPGQSRNIRVGSTLMPGAREKAFRIIVEQLPVAAIASGKSAGLTMLLRISIPIFIAPTTLTSQGQIEHLQVADGKVSFALRNTGTAHLLARQVRVEGKGADGEPLLDKSQSGSYVLEGGERQFSLDLPADLCRRMKKVSVAIRTEGSSLSGAVDVPREACPR
jgi:fimbrial chaperone protein